MLPLTLSLSLSLLLSHIPLNVSLIDYSMPFAMILFHPMIKECFKRSIVCQNYLSVVIIMTDVRM